MINTKFVNVDEVRSELIGKQFEIIDIEHNGQAIYLKDNKGKIIVIDYIVDKENGAQVIAQKTDCEKLEELETKFNILLGMTNVDVEELEEKFQKTL